jgi:hypothetical protein
MRRCPASGANMIGKSRKLLKSDCEDSFAFALRRECPTRISDGERSISAVHGICQTHRRQSLSGPRDRLMTTQLDAQHPTDWLRGSSRDHDKVTREDDVARSLVSASSCCVRGTAALHCRYRPRTTATGCTPAGGPDLLPPPPPTVWTANVRSGSTAQPSGRSAVSAVTLLPVTRLQQPSSIAVP